MADFPLSEITKYATSDSISATGGASNVKGAWAEVWSASPFDAAGIWINYYGSSKSNKHLIDIGIGAAGSEVVIIGNIHWNEYNYTGSVLFLPISIPAGSRIVTRTQSNTASAVAYIKVSLAAQGFMQSQPPNKCTTFGADTSDSGGLVVDPGAVAETKGAWVEFSSSLPHPISWLNVELGCRGNSAMSDYWFYFDIGIGAAGSEVVIIPDVRFRTTAYNDEVHPSEFSFPVSIPAGSRLVARVLCSGTDSSDRLIDFVMQGVI